MKRVSEMCGKTESDQIFVNQSPQREEVVKIFKEIIIPFSRIHDNYKPTNPRSPPNQSKEIMKKSTRQRTTLSISSSPQPPATTILLSTWLCLTILNTSCKRNHEVFGFCDWFSLLSKMSFRFIHVIANDKLSLFFKAE